MATLVYGLKDNKLYNIDEVNNGIECNCVCPNCKGALIAKQGKIKEHHFAHESKECDITIAQETALHYMAKEILSECKTIKLPKVILRDEFAFYNIDEYRKILYDNFKIINKYNLYHEYSKYQDNIRTVDNVILEKYIDNIKPDIIMDINDKQLLIEIAVTHFIDETKKQKIFDKLIPTIEIDLSSFKEKINVVFRDELKYILTKEANYKNWIYYQNVYQDCEEVKVKNNIIVQKIIELNKYYTDNFNKSYRLFYDNNCRDTTNKYITEFWNKQWLSKEMPMPWFVDYPINGDILYNGDRRRWESVVISKIYYSKTGMSEEEMVKFITDQKFLKVYDSNYGASFEERQKYLLKKTNRYQVVRDYYKFLLKQNVIDINGKWIYKLN